LWAGNCQDNRRFRPSPRCAASIQLFRDHSLDFIPTHGPLSWSVPGCVDGWEELRKKFGTMSLEQILEPTIQYAENGFPVSEVISGSWRGGATPRIAATPEVYEGKIVIKREVLPDGRVKMILKDPVSGDFADVVVAKA
jgi:gamma-glutamyltranspeptidase